MAAASPTSASSDAIAAIIDRHWSELARPDVLAVRPGYEVTDDWFTGRPAIVVTVIRKREDVSASDQLPDELEGVPVDVRQATPLKRLELTDPAAYAAELRLAPDTGSIAHFPDERVAVGPAVAASPSAHAFLAQVAKPELPYSAPEGAQLKTVTGEMTLTLCASPDAGWRVLQPFLAATTTRLTVGMYDCTSAHVADELAAASKGKKLAMTLDHPPLDPAADQTDEDTVHHLTDALGPSFSQAWALTRLDPLATSWIYPTAYHIKVAVRDGSSTWLSSGNWNNSNQPAIDPVTDGLHSPAATEARHRDRDWHITIDDTALAATFESYLAHDLQVASQHDRPTPAPGTPITPAPLPQKETPAFHKFFAPARLSGSFTVTPLLTPDPSVYAGTVLRLIDGAKSRLYLQFQYIELPRVMDATTKAFTDLIDAVIAKQNAGLDVRIICSQYETLAYLEQLIARGLDVKTVVRIQNYVHNKGIIADGTSVLVSSQNWSADGVLQNRDAGVIVTDHAGKAASYFEEIFLHDWGHLAASHQRE